MVMQLLQSVYEMFYGEWKGMSGLKEKAKTLSDLFWENELEWNKWLRMGVTESKQVTLAPKYQERWVRLEDAQKEIDEKSEGYSKVCARLHEQVIDFTMKDKELKQKLQQLLKKARAERMEHALDYPDAPASPLWERNQGKIEILEELLKEEKEAKT